MANMGVPEKKISPYFYAAVIGCIVAMPIVMLLGYLLDLSSGDEGQIQIFELLTNSEEYLEQASIGGFFSAMLHGGMTAKATIIGFFASLIVIMYVLMGDGKRYHRKGSEHGSARWGSKAEKDIIADTNDFYNNVICASDITLVLDRKKRDKNEAEADRKKSDKKKKIQPKKKEKSNEISHDTNIKVSVKDIVSQGKEAGKIKPMLNLNQVILGGSGTGKSRFFVKPNLLMCNTSYIVTDPSGELVQACGQMLINHGYKIKVFNLNDMKHSSNYNPFHYLRDYNGEINANNVTQAYYYLNYGDWYGGTYNYSSPDINFYDFFSEYCQSIVSEIQSYYYDLIAAAPNVNQKNALIDAMNNAISTAISNAMPAALAEYNALMASLDDSLTAETHRQHYETEQQSVPNNNADSAEFTGMPVVGTNHFGNVEINSELSAEELLAYIALYKSMSIINPDDSDPDAEQILNITPQDIMDFFEETEFIPITTDVTHGNFCSGMNCKRRLVDEAWEYYCDGDHDNLSGEIGACKTADELREKVMELTDAESNGVDEDSFNKLIEEYMKLIKKELDITEADYRKFGAADNTKAQEYYQKLIDEGAISNNFWNVETPIGEEDSDE